MTCYCKKSVHKKYTIIHTVDGCGLNEVIINSNQIVILS